jgi:hypothetical protein
MLEVAQTSEAQRYVRHGQKTNESFLDTCDAQIDHCGSAFGLRCWRRSRRHAKLLCDCRGCELQAEGRRAIWAARVVDRENLTSSQRISPTLPVRQPTTQARVLLPGGCHVSQHHHGPPQLRVSGRDFLPRGNRHHRVGDVFPEERLKNVAICKVQNARVAPGELQDRTVKSSWFARGD